MLFKVREMDMKRIIYSSLKLLLIAIALNALHSCRNTCEPICCGGEKETSLYFTALSENDGIPLVFQLSEDFADLNLLKENARIYSAPAKNGDYCYSRENLTSGRTEIYLANLLGTEDKNITENIVNFDYTSPVINPQGGSIAMNSQDNRLYLYSYGSASEQLSILSSAILPKSAANFSPDGRYVAFFTGQYPSVSLNLYDVVNAEGPNQIFTLNNVIDNRRGQVIAGWDEESKHLCFAFDKTEGMDTIKAIYIVDLAGNQSNVITNNKLGIHQASFSPQNSRQLLFASQSGDLWIADISDSEPKFIKLTENKEGEINSNPVWSANSEKIVFTKFFDDSKEDSELYMLDNNTKSEILISNQAFSAYWRR